MGLFLASSSLRMGQFSNPVATHPRTNEAEVPPPRARFSKTFLTISMDAIFTTVIDWILIQIIHLLLINNTYHH